MESFTTLDQFHQVVNRYEDPRIRDWFLMSSPIPTLVATAAYLFIIKITLPNHMRDRKAYQLKNVVLYYNFAQVLLSTWLVYAFLSGGWLKPKYNWQCILPTANKTLILATYVYYISKFTEFMDTVLFVLRKKDNQVTNLHLYHHMIMPIGSWICFKYVPDSTMTFLGFINSVIHMVMYSYYLLSGLGPKMQKYLWWKKYVTVLQLVQFVFGITHSVQAAVFGCLPRALSLFNFFQGILFFLMFYDFYVYTYKKKQPSNKYNGTNGTIYTNGVTKQIIINQNNNHFVDKTL